MEGVTQFTALRDTEPIVQKIKEQGVSVYWDYADRTGDDWEYAVVDGKRIQCGNLFLFVKNEQVQPIIEETPVITAPIVDDPVKVVVIEEPGEAKRKKHRK